jgi:GntR family transcriptional repressor for pyruvate dehydrogenase complex
MEPGNSLYKFNSIESREPISNRIVSEIENAIKWKKIPVMGRLPSEKELCLQFNVSRNVMREALKVLNGMGLINFQKGKGIFVNDITSESVSNHIERYLSIKFEITSILDMFDVRLAIEPNIVAAAAINRSEEDIFKLKENVTKFCDQKINFKERSILDGEFHCLIAKSTKNSYFSLIMEPVYNVMHEIRKAVFPAVKESGHSAELWHKKILDSIIKKDPEKARNYLKSHLEISKSHARKWIQKINRDIDPDTMLHLKRKRR